jgi:hypothetical protein
MVNVFSGRARLIALFFVSSFFERCL